MSHPEPSRLLGGPNRSPGDDTLRLVIAGCLEEHGEPPGAEKVRLSRRLRGMDQASGP